MRFPPDDGLDWKDRRRHLRQRHSEEIDVALAARTPPIALRHLTTQELRDYHAAFHTDYSHD